jgi:hypothetical protein
MPSTRHGNFDAQNLFIGCAAGGSGDRTDSAAPIVATLIAHGQPSVLIFENLAERTLALAQLARRANPGKGYDPLLEAQLRPILADCLNHNIAIVSNFGAANPRGAADHIHRLAAELGLAPPRVAVVEGDDLSGVADSAKLRSVLPKQFADQPIVSANVYQGAFEIAEALQAGAQIVVTGRVVDSALALGPAIAHFGWGREDWNQLAGATMAGHLLECGAQVTGGYFADPGFKEVPDLANVGYPVVEIMPDGSCVVGKAAHTGGMVNELTVKEQLLYEIHDPQAYLTPDVTVDLSDATVRQIAKDRVCVEGVTGKPRPLTLKALVFYEGGWLGEAEISYAGPNAEPRARLAMDVVRQRMGGDISLRFDLIGVVSVLGDSSGEMLSRHRPGLAQDVRLRVAGRHEEETEIDRLLREVYSLWLCGPAGGGGVRTAKRQRLSNISCLLPRATVPARYSFHEAHV